MARLSLRKLWFRESRLVSTVLITAGSRAVSVSYLEYEGGESSNGDGGWSLAMPKSQLLKKQGSAGYKDGLKNNPQREKGRSRPHSLRDGAEVVVPPEEKQPHPPCGGNADHAGS